MNRSTVRRAALHAGLTIAAAGAVLAVGAAPAQAVTAATITAIGPDALGYEPGSYSPDLLVSRSGNNMLIFKDQKGGRITTNNPNCVDHVLQGQVQCRANGIYAIKLNGTSGPDKFVNDSGIDSVQSGLGGDDYLVGDWGVYDRIIAGPGKDSVYTSDSGQPHKDDVDCGSEVDIWLKDSADIGTNCEDGLAPRQS
jgi:hypothetical protein